MMCCLRPSPPDIVLLANMTGAYSSHQHHEGQWRFICINEDYVHNSGVEAEENEAQERFALALPRASIDHEIGHLDPKVSL